MFSPQQTEAILLAIMQEQGLEVDDINDVILHERKLIYWNPGTQKAQIMHRTYNPTQRHTFDGAIGACDDIFVSDNGIVTIVDHTGRGKKKTKANRQFDLIPDGEDDQGNPLFNSRFQFEYYERLFMEYFVSISNQTNFKQLCEFMGVDPMGTPQAICAGLANQHCTFKIDPLPIEEEILELHVETNYDATESDFDIRMSLTLGDEEMMIHRPSIEVWPENNSFHERWRGDAITGKVDIDITTDFRDRRPGLLYLICDDTEQLKDCFVRIRGALRNEDGTLAWKRWEGKVDMSQLKAYDYFGTPGEWPEG